MHLLRSDFINDWLTVNFDIIFISETHLTKGQIFELKNFGAVHNPYSTVDDIKPRGGISCFIKTNFSKHVKRSDISVPENIIVTFKNGDVIFGSYVPPSDSPYHNITDISAVANMFVPKDHDHVVFGGGDLNGRVGDVKMNAPSKNIKYLPNVDTIVNDCGKEILKMCRSFRCFIVNNLQFQNKIFESNFTFYKGNRKSQNDIILANMSALNAIEKFEVHNVVWNPSDHTPVSVTFKMSTIENDFSKFASADLLTERWSEKQLKPKKLFTSDIDWEKFSNLVASDFASYEDKAERLNVSKSLEDLDVLVSKFSDSVYNAAYLNSNKQQNDDEISQDNIFPTIEDLLTIQNSGEVNGGAWKKVRDEAVDHLRKDVSEKDHQNWSHALNSKDPRLLWTRINWKGDFTTKQNDEKPELNELASHFATKGQAGRGETLLCDVSGDNYVPSLDDDITTDEIIEAEELKEDKVSGDGWVKKMVTSLPAPLLLLLQLIFNSILKFHIFPTAWRTTVVGELFKNKGSRVTSKNYRGLSLVQLLAKLFDTVFLRRFKRWFTPADEQTAYTPERGSPDHVFLIRCMLQYAKRTKQTLFLIAIDFDGAFDRVCRSTLIKKLCLFGAGAVFTACLASIYMCTDNIIYRGDSNVKFKLYSGIKQGLPLSPLLFLFYINDIFDFFGALYDGGKKFFDVLHILIHADDATIIASSRNDAICKLKTMLIYCGLNKIIPQFTKCEFLVANGTEEDRAPLPFGDTSLDCVEHLLLLGSHLTHHASLFDEGELHMKKRFSSVVKYYNFLRSNRSAPTKVKMKVLRSCVTTSLLHNCEAFGPDIPKDLEPTYLKLLKSCFNVRSSTPNFILYIESGFLPIKFIIYLRQYKFYKRFRQSIHAKSRREKMMSLLLEQQTKFLKHYEKLVSNYASTDEILNEGLDFVKQKIRTFATNGRSKFSMYLKLNPNLETSPFLHIVHPTASDIIRFRVGSHYLPIETGRWCRKQRHERLCTSCGTIGDEEHILYHCSLISRVDLSIDDVSSLWFQPDVYELFSRIKAAKFL